MKCAYCHGAIKGSPVVRTSEDGTERHYHLEHVSKDAARLSHGPLDEKADELRDILTYRKAAARIVVEFCQLCQDAELDTEEVASLASEDDEDLDVWLHERIEELRETEDEDDEETADENVEALTLQAKAAKKLRADVAALVKRHPDTSAAEFYDAVPLIATIAGPSVGDVDEAKAWARAWVRTVELAIEIRQLLQGLDEDAAEDVRALAFD